MGVIGPDNELLALTAAHVVGSLSAAHGQDPIEVLLTQNAAPGSGDPRLGLVAISHPEEPCEEIEIDASLIRLEAGVKTGNVLRDTPMSGLPRDLEQVHEEIAVYKRGMTMPHLTSGMLDPDVRSLKVSSPNAGCDREYIRGFFVYGTDREAPFAKPGDSGSIVVDDDDRIVGMVVAVKLKNPESSTPDSDDPAFVVAMTDILAALDFRLPGPAR